jgi:hypothetical protein
MPFEGFGGGWNKPTVPPGGYAGNQSQTPAAQAVSAPSRLFGFGSATDAPRRRRRRRKKATKRKKTRAPMRKTRTKRKLKRLVKGSRAAKAYMARIRKLRK